MADENDGKVEKIIESNDENAACTGYISKQAIINLPIETSASVGDGAGNSSVETSVAAPCVLLSSITAVATTAAAGSRCSVQPNDDASLALQMFVLEQLTSIYGFDRKVSQEAIENTISESGNNNPSDVIEVCCNYILSNDLGTDNGGPVLPINDCPHVINDSDVPMLNPVNLFLNNYYYPKLAKCTHDMKIDGVIEKGGKTVYDDDDGNEKESNELTGECPSTENWLCLHCGAVRCSRYVNGHNLFHWEGTKSMMKDEESKRSNDHNDGHCLVLSLTDLSVWCHACCAYINNPRLLNPIISHLQEMKFPSSAVE